MLIKNKLILKLLDFLDKNILFLISVFLIFFIPLWPKMPLFSPIKGYIVRIRLEDILIAMAVLIYLIQLLRKKIKINKLFTKLIAAYIIISFLSLFSAIFIIKTIPLMNKHLAKSFLHFLRYIEYFALFFIFAASLKNVKQIKIILANIAVTILGVSLYGFGQKFFYWPVYSTMNREFSEGIELYLTEYARVQSTFAGHYDLAAYLVLVLPILLALALYHKNKLIKIMLGLINLSGVWLLIATASRISFISYLIAINLVFFLFALKQKKLAQKIKYWLSYLFLASLIISPVLWWSGGSLLERLLQVIPIKEKSQIILNSDTRPVSSKVDAATESSTKSAKPADVYVDVPDIVEMTTISATGEEVTYLIKKPREFSDNAQKYGLSLAIRLDTLWPQAIKGFWKNPLLGSGYATLNKQDLYDFTEIDGVDNNFLRTLGETGLMGFMSFYLIILIALILSLQAIKKSKSKLLIALSIAYLAGSLGLLVNASFIDVFAASKVAFTFWTMTGILVAFYYLENVKKNKK